jgi:hypothetical protein
MQNGVGACKNAVGALLLLVWFFLTLTPSIPRVLLKCSLKQNQKFPT